MCYSSGLTVSFGECQALIDLYESTDGEAWFDQTGWGENPDVNTWYGVTVQSGHVHTIDLGNALMNQNNLSGSLPNSLGDLEWLVELYLAHNDIN